MEYFNRLLGYLSFICLIGCSPKVVQKDKSIDSVPSYDSSGSAYSLFSWSEWKATQTESPEWFSAKGALYYEDGEQSFSGTLHLRIRKDSIIWASIQKLGFEGGRISIDSALFRIVNRVSGEAIVMPLESLLKKWDIPISYNELQHILWYNSIEPKTCQLDCSMESNKVQMNCRENYHLTYQINPAKNAIQYFSLQNKKYKSGIEMNGADFRNVTGLKKWIPFQTVLLIKDKDNSSRKIQIEWESVEVNVPKKMSFSIPENYPVKIDF